MAKHWIDPEKVWIFGSQARGNATRYSDIDMAFSFDTVKKQWWGSFVADVEENARTLLEFDLVDMNSCEPALRDEILKTGKILYERKSQY